ncbi:hypothetical protein F4805DRAFT_466637 [Annulohypoxylon moriforme]|nr:hypothetical protein F4805DRAFT_466637 [Annulohypoxylon moriforme]
MAESIAALGLVCSVMQVISFSGKVIGLYRRIVKDGSPEAGLASNTAHLSSLMSVLQERTNQFNEHLIGCRLETADFETELARTRLNTLASDIAKDTEKLRSLLQEVMIASSAGRIHRIKVGFKYKIRYQTQISSLEKRINRARNVLSLELLNEVCSSSQANYCRSEQKFSNLDTEMKQFVNRWSEGKRTISELIVTEAQVTRAHVSLEAEHTRNQIGLIDVRLQSDASRRELEGIRERILSSLRFPEMNQRESNIAEAPSDIPYRIFPRSTLANWLQSGEGVFWISGKPGGGKSTLVKHLVHNVQTIEHLRTWKPLVAIFRFYFYEMGSNPLQRQLLGCQRTLLYQILESDLETKMLEHDWSLQELYDALSVCLHYRDQATCFFVDGLDEIQPEERGKIVDFVESLKNMPNTKACVTSRPEILFRKRLRSYSTFRVQDITAEAICAYVQETLRKYKDSFGVSEKEYQLFLQRLVLKSEGVFLWVVIALKNIIIGIEKHGDSWELLNQRIGEFAPDLNDLYRQMWSRQNADLPIFGSTRPDLRGELQYLIRICHKFQEWLLIRTAGMIEVNYGLAIPNDFEDRVHFIHRSAREFLEGTEDGQHIMKHDNRSSQAKDISFVEAAIDTAYIWAAEPLIKPEKWPPRKRRFATKHIGAINIACAGDMTVLSSIYKIKELFGNIHSREKSEVLFFCCSRMFIPWWELDKWTRDRSGSSENTFPVGLRIATHKMDCIKWLIDHGANPHQSHKEEELTPLVDRVYGQRYFKVVDNPTSFRMFLAASFIGFLQLPQKVNNQETLVRTYTEEILSCVDVFDRLARNDQDNILIECDAEEERDEPQTYRILLNVPWFLKYLNEIANPEITTDRDVFLQFYLKWDYIQFHSAFAGRRWLRLAVSNKWKNMNELKIAFAKYLVQINENAGSTGYWEMADAAGWDITGVENSIVWEELKDKAS